MELQTASKWLLMRCYTNMTLPDSLFTVWPILRVLVKLSICTSVPVQLSGCSCTSLGLYTLLGYTCTFLGLYILSVCTFLSIYEPFQAVPMYFSTYEPFHAVPIYLSTYAPFHVVTEHLLISAPYFRLYVEQGLTFITSIMSRNSNVKIHVQISGRLTSRSDINH